MKQNAEINGSGRVMGGEYDSIEINGSGKIMGDVSFQQLEINGSCNSLGSLEGDSVEINGNLKVEGDVRVRSLEINGMLKNGMKKVYADHIEINGVLKNEDEISADYIEVNGRTYAQDMVGDHIQINYGGSHIFRNLKIFGFIFGEKNRSDSNCANNIECTWLQAQYMNCKTISAQKIELRNNCNVEVINCDGTLLYDSSCKIGKINGECSITVE